MKFYISGRRRTKEFDDDIHNGEWLALGNKGKTVRIKLG